MDKKAQSGVIGFIFLVFIFVAMWFIFIGGYIAEIGQTAIILSSLTGVEAFLLANLNVFIFNTLCLGIIGFFSLGGGKK